MKKNKEIENQLYVIFQFQTQKRFQPNQIQLFNCTCMPSWFRVYDSQQNMYTEHVTSSSSTQTTKKVYSNFKRKAE